MNSRDKYSATRILYIIEAAIEYFIATLISGPYLSRLATEIGFSTAATGVITAFTSLGCLFHLVAIFIADKTPVKKWVVAFTGIHEVFFILCFFIPFLKSSTLLKMILLASFVLLGKVILNIINSPKITMYMNLVPDKKRGQFTAIKEIVSLLGGMGFTFLMSYFIDNFTKNGNLLGSFIFCGVGMAILTIFHLLLLFFSKEKPVDRVKVNHGQHLKNLFHNKKLMLTVTLFILVAISDNAIKSFLPTYQLKELGFSMTYVTICSAILAVSRAILSIPMGKFADRYSFVKMLNVCLIFNIAAAITCMFIVPGNAKYLFIIYCVLDGAAWSGINSASMNLTYDCVNKNERTSAYALKSAAAGLFGFLISLSISPLVDSIEKNGNSFLGIENIYAQQVCACIGVIISFIIILYLNLFIRPLFKRKTLLTQGIDLSKINNEQKKE